MNELLQSISNVDVCLASLKDFFTQLSVSKVIMTLLMVFMLVGIVDKLRGNKKGYGARFDEGFMAMGPLALSIFGIVALSPVLLVLLRPIITPLYGLLGANPAMFPASILALDMGGFVLSMQLAGESTAVGLYAGVIVASMMGITMCFTIPYALTVMKKEDHPILATGILIGMITMPIGCIVGGLLMQTTSHPLPFGQLMANTLPVIVIALIIALGLFLFRDKTLKAFIAFGKGVTAIITVSPAIAVFQYITGIRLPLFYLMVEHNEVMGAVPVEAGLMLVGQIAIVLIGAFPMIHFLNKVLEKPIAKIGSRFHINNAASTGLLTQLASSIPIWSVIDEMNERGKLYNVAFAVSGSFVLGDVLAFVGSVAPEMTFPVIAAKLVAGVAAVLLVALMPAHKHKAEDS